MRKLTCLLVVICLSTIAIAQDNNMLARVAYEDAETALSNGDYTKTLQKLDKVDQYLGTVTPKAQYLRAQAWNMAASKNSATIEKAISVCKTYLDLTKNFQLPEDKVLEITTIMVRLQEQKDGIDAAAAWSKSQEDAVKDREENTIPKIMRLLDAFVEKRFKVRIYDTIDSFLLARPEAKDLFADKYKSVDKTLEYQGIVRTSYFDKNSTRLKYEKPLLDYFVVENDKVTRFTETIIVTDRYDTADSVFNDLTRTLDTQLAPLLKQFPDRRYGHIDKGDIDYQDRFYMGQQVQMEYVFSYSDAGEHFFWCHIISKGISRNFTVHLAASKGKKPRYNVSIDFSNQYK